MDCPYSIYQASTDLLDTCLLTFFDPQFICWMDFPLVSICEIGGLRSLKLTIPFHLSDCMLAWFSQYMDMGINFSIFKQSIHTEIIWGLGNLKKCPCLQTVITPFFPPWQKRRWKFCSSDILHNSQTVFTTEEWTVPWFWCQLTKLLSSFYVILSNNNFMKESLCFSSFCLCPFKLSTMNIQMYQFISSK